METQVQFSDWSPCSRSSWWYAVLGVQRAHFIHHARKAGPYKYPPWLIEYIELIFVPGIALGSSVAELSADITAVTQGKSQHCRIVRIAVLITGTT